MIHEIAAIFLAFAKLHRKTGTRTLVLRISVKAHLLNFRSGKDISRAQHPRTVQSSSKPLTYYLNLQLTKIEDFESTCILLPNMMNHFQVFVCLLIIVLVQSSRFRGAIVQPNGIAVSNNFNQNTQVETIPTDTLVLDTIPESDIQYGNTVTNAEHSVYLFTEDTIEEREDVPTNQPTSQPTAQPTSEPSSVPTSQPSKIEIVANPSVKSVQKLNLPPSQVPVMKSITSLTIFPSYNSQNVVITLPPISAGSEELSVSPTYQTSAVPFSTYKPVVTSDQPSIQVSTKPNEQSIGWNVQPSALPTIQKPNTKSQQQCLCNWATNCDWNNPCCDGLECQDHGMWSQCVEPASVLSKENCISSENGYGCHTTADCCNPDAECKDKFCNLPCASSTNMVPVPVPTTADVPFFEGCHCNWAVGCSASTPCCLGLVCQQHEYWSQCVEPELILSKENCISSNNGYGCQSASDCCNPHAECTDKFCHLPCTD